MVWRKLSLPKTHPGAVPHAGQKISKERHLHIRDFYPVINRLVKSDIVLIVNSIGAPILFMQLILFTNHKTTKKFWGSAHASFFGFFLVAGAAAGAAFTGHDDISRLLAEGHSGDLPEPDPRL